MTRSELVEQALERVEAPEVLINMVSRRVRQLGQGLRPLVYASPKMSLMDVALTEIAEGKLSYEWLGDTEEDIQGGSIANSSAAI